MKKAVLGTVTVSLYMALQVPALAQTKANVMAYITNSVAQHYELRDEKNFPETYANDISMKARRNFTRSFESITDEKWYKIKDGYFASFKKDDVNTEVYYNNRGTKLYNLLTYHEDQLDSPVRDLVKEKYNAYSILKVFEYQFFDGPIYIIKMKKINNYKTVMVFDNEIRLIEEFNNTD